MSTTKFTALSLLGILIIFSFHQSTGQSTYKYEVEKVVEDVYVLKPIMNKYRWVSANIIAIINEKDILVVDSGLLPEAGQSAINEIKKISSKPVRYLVNTHWHGDHWQGNEAFLKEYPNVEIISTEQGFKGMARNGMVWAKQFYIRYFNYYVSDFENSIAERKLKGEDLTDIQLLDLKTGLKEMKQDLESIKQLNPILPHTTYSDNLIIRRGNREIHLLYLGIGNTSGDAVVFMPKEKVLVTGDLVVYPSPFESGMFSPEWLETSEKLAQLNYAFLIPGHGEVQNNHDYLNFLNAFYREIINQVTAAYLNGKSGLEEINATVTHQSVMDSLKRIESFRKYTDKISEDFVPGAIQTSLKRIIQGKILE